MSKENDNILNGLEIIGPGSVEAQEDLLEITVDTPAEKPGGDLTPLDDGGLPPGITGPGSAPKPQTAPVEELIEVPDDKTKGGAPIDDNQSSSPFSVLANEYIDRGLLPKDNEEVAEAIKNIQDWDGFFDLYKRFAQEDSLADLNESQKEYLKALRSGVPVREYEQFQQATDYLNSLNDETLKQEQTVTNIANVFYAVKGIDDDERKALVALAKDKGVENTKKMVTFLKDYYKGEYDKAFSKYGDESKLKYDTSKANVENISSFIKEKPLFEGLKLTEVGKQKVIKIATEIVNPDSDKPFNAVAKLIAEDPIGMQAKLAYVYMQTDGFKNLAGFNRKAESDSTKALKALAQKQTPGSPFGSGTQQVTNNNGKRTAQIASALEKALNV